MRSHRRWYWMGRNVTCRQVGRNVVLRAILYKGMGCYVWGDRMVILIAIELRLPRWRWHIRVSATRIVIRWHRNSRSGLCEPTKKGRILNTFSFAVKCTASKSYLSKRKDVSQSDPIIFNIFTFPRCRPFHLFSSLPIDEQRLEFKQHTRESNFTVKFLCKN